MVEGATHSLKARILSLIMICACCCTVEGTREDANLALDTSVQFYVVMGMAAVGKACVGFGLEFRLTWNARVESRHARRLRRLQEAVGEEINHQLADMGPPGSARLHNQEAVETPPPIRRRVWASDVVEIVSPPRERPSAPTRVGPTSTTTSTRVPSSSTPRGTQSTAMARGTMVMSGHHRDALISAEDTATQVDDLGFVYLPPEPAVARLEIREVFPDEYYMTQHGAHAHAPRNCWGLRNASNVVTRRLCECCRSNEGRSLYDRQT